MATKTIPQLSEVTSISGSAVLPVDTGVVTRRISAANLAQSLRPLSAAPLISVKTSNYSPTAVQAFGVIPLDSSGGSFNINLPAPSTMSGKYFTIKDVVGALEDFPVTLVRYGSEEIEGEAADYVLDFAGGSFVLFSDGTDWFFISTLPVAASSSAGGGAIRNVVMGEPILATDLPAAIYLAAKKAFVVIAGVNDKIDFNEGSGARTSTLTPGIYRMDNSFERQKFFDMVDAAFAAATGGAITGTYTSSLDPSTRLINISSTVSFSLLNNTGANAGQNAAVQLFGFSGAADTSSGTSQDADDEVDAFYSNKLFGLKTDASYAGRSRGFQGVVDVEVAQYGLASVLKQATIDTFTGLTETKELYTARASIIIDATNDKIDFDEGGGELTGTIAHGEYRHDGTASHGGLAEAIIAAMDGAGADNYDAAFNNDTDEFEISSDGTFELLNGTGSNIAVSAAPSLGYPTTDTGVAESHTGDPLALRGKLVMETNERVNENSVFGALAQGTVSAHVQRGSVDKYLEVLNLPGEFLTAPDDLSPGFAVAFGDQACNSVGQGVRAFWDTTSSPEVLRFQYRQSPSGPWLDSASTFAANVDMGLNTSYDNGSINSVGQAPRIVIDENGKGFCIASGIWFGSAYNVRGFHTTDGGATWAKVTGNRTAANDLAGDGSNNFLVGGIRQRGTKVVYALSNTASSGGEFGYSEDTGSGYGTATSQSTSAMEAALYGTGIEIQYFPAETGQNKWRFIFVSKVFGGATVRCVYMKGDLSGLATINFSASSLDCIAMTRELRGGGNRVAGLLGGAVADTLIPFYFSDTYSAGVLTLTEGSNQNSGGVNISHTNGFRAEDQRHSNWGLQHKMVMINGRAWAAVQHNFSSIHRYKLWKCASVVTNTWTDAGEVLASDSTNQQGEMRLIPCVDKNAMVAVWKRGTNSTTLSQNLSNGQIFQRVIDIESNGAVLSFHAASQIDANEALGTFQGGLTAHPHADGVGVSWAKSTNIVRSQKFI